MQIADYVDSDTGYRYLVRGDQRYSIKCDVCGSEHLILTNLSLPPVEVITMDELVKIQQNPINIVPAILKYRNIEIRCANCGYTIGYQEPIL